MNRPGTREKNSEYGMPTDTYLPIIINMENSNLLDHHTAALLKNLILEENIEIFRLINCYIAKMIDENELCFKLNRLAYQMM